MAWILIRKIFWNNGLQNLNWLTQNARLFSGFHNRP